MGVLDTEKKGLALIVHHRIHFAHVVPAPPDDNGAVVIAKVFSVQLKQLHQQHAKILTSRDLATLKLGMQLQETEYQECHAVAAKAAREHFRESSLLQKLLENHDKGPNSRLLDKPPIDELGRLKTVRLVDRDVNMELAQRAHEFDDGHFCTGNYLDIPCQFVGAQAAGHPS